VYGVVLAAGSEDASAAVRSARRLLVARADDLGDNVLGSGLPRALAASASVPCGFVGTPAGVGLMDTRGLAYVAAVDCRPRTRSDVARAGHAMRRAVAHFNPDVVLLPRYGFEREALGLALVGSRRNVVTWEKHATPKRARRSWWLSLLPGPRLAAAGAPLHELARLQHFASFLGLDPSTVLPALSPALLGPWNRPPELAGCASPIVALGIGAAQARRWWPVERFADLAVHLAGRGYVPVLLGSSDEAPRARQLVEDLSEGAQVVDLVGRLALADTARLLRHCALYVGNDSGIGHIAAAAGTATVTISCHPAGAPASHVNAPERYAPAGPRSVVVRPDAPHDPGCASGCVPVNEPCCILEVPLAAVSEACDALLAVASSPAVVEEDGR
jgi:ADP-heptose:LPS heptosyltransferase